jgi:hypothetical protein
MGSNTIRATFSVNLPHPGHARAAPEARQEVSPGREPWEDICSIQEPRRGGTILMRVVLCGAGALVVFLFT